MGKGEGRSQEVFGGKVRVWGGTRGAGSGMGVECRRVSCVEGKGAQREWGGPPRAWGREVRMAAEPQLRG